MASEIFALKMSHCGIQGVWEGQYWKVNEPEELDCSFVGVNVRKCAASFLYKFKYLDPSCAFVSLNLVSGRKKLIAACQGLGL